VGGQEAWGTTFGWWAAGVVLGMINWWATSIGHDLWLVGSPHWAQPFGWWAVGIGRAVGQALHNLVVVVNL